MINHHRSLVWRKATTSNPSGNCVELAATASGEIAVRNSREPRGPVLKFTRGELQAFLDGANRHEFDDLAR